MSAPDKRLLAAIVDYLQAHKGAAQEPDSIDLASQMIASSFDVSDADRSDWSKTGKTLGDIFVTAVPAPTRPEPSTAATEATAAAGERSEDDHLMENAQFKRFVAELNSKNFFSGLKEGTPEYANRFEKAVQAFKRTPTGKAVLASLATASSAGPVNDEIAADALKSEGNAHMASNKFKEAVDSYTAAIEKAPSGKSTHIYYANRAAAKTSLKDYDGAISDARRATLLCPSFAKGFSRLGVALELKGDIAQAVREYERAAELEPDSEAFRGNLEKARGKLRGRGSAAGADRAPTAPAAPGGLDFASLLNNPMVANMLKDPAMTQMAQNMMSNPAMRNSLMSMMGGLGGMGGAFAEMAGMGGPGGADELELDDDVPASGMPTTAPSMADLQAALDDPSVEHLRSDPEVAEIFEQVRMSGPAALLSHMSHPKIQELLTAVTSRLGRR